MYFTWFGANTWLLEIGHQRILLDPWLVDNLVFGGAEWFFKGFRTEECTIPENLDLILLSQGLPDHSHPPTLKRLKGLPVVASPNAARVVQALGYNSITALAFRESFILNDEVEIRALPGSLVGYNLVENAYLITELATGFKLYYEPHGNHAPEIKQFAPVDVLIIPVIDLALPLVGAFIKGGNQALKVAQWLEPQVILPTTAGGNIIFEGLLGKLQQPHGSIDDFRLSLRQHNLTTQVMTVVTGDRIELQLSKRVENR